MIVVVCSRCSARFRLAAEKIRAEGTRVRCSRCESVFLVRQARQPSVVEGTPQAGEAGAPGMPPGLTDRAAGLPATGLPATGLPATGLPATGSQDPRPGEAKPSVSYLEPPLPAPPDAEDDLWAMLEQSHIRPLPPSENLQPDSIDEQWFGDLTPEAPEPSRAVAPHVPSASVPTNETSGIDGIESSPAAGLLPSLGGSPSWEPPSDRSMDGELGEFLLGHLDLQGEPDGPAPRHMLDRSGSLLHAAEPRLPSTPPLAMETTPLFGEAGADEDHFAHQRPLPMAPPSHAAGRPSGSGGGSVPLGAMGVGRPPTPDMEPALEWEPGGNPAGQRRGGSLLATPLAKRKRNEAALPTRGRHDLSHPMGAGLAAVVLVLIILAALRPGGILPAAQQGQLPAVRAPGVPGEQPGNGVGDQRNLGRDKDEKKHE